ncbi:serine-rich adhesin for platelets-like isoform X2 [Panonychus citri]|uniref:serine-rich adhesin for platelets-like isoform X2 n=1 Tax=Panonychus citri TaxID=50023 RepID=UPI00230828BA|nr:serine-rich adhesin for platelets-like isoform X2 [Panonychus citri]
MLHIIVISLILSCDLTSGSIIREAPASGSIDETINVFSSIADDKNFTSVKPEGDVNKTESATDKDKVPVEVKLDKEKPEKEEDKIKPSVVDESAKPSTSTSTSLSPSPSTSTTTPSSSSSSSTTTVSSSTSSSTSTPKPLSSANETSVDKPMVISMNDTNPIVDMTFVNNNDTMAMFSSLDSMFDLEGTNDTTNNLDASGGISSNDEFSNLTRIDRKSSSSKVRSISTPEELEVDNNYKPPIDLLPENDEKVALVTSVSTIDEVTKLMETKTVTEAPVEGEKLEIIVDEPRTAESEKHWSKFSKVTGYKIIWKSDKNQNERTANAEEKEEKNVDHHEDDGHKQEDDNDDDDDFDQCDTIDRTDYFIDEIADLVKMESMFGQSNQKVIKTIRCWIMGLSKILETQDEEIDDWTDDSVLPLKEINRLERKIEDEQNFKCNCSIPSVGNVLNSIYTDPFLNEKRVTLYKNHDWSSTIGDLRSSHVKIKHFYFQLHRHHVQIENLFNVSITMSNKLYQWRSKQMDIVMNNSRRIRQDRRHYNRG